MGNSMKLYDENYKKLNIFPFRILYNGSSYVKIIDVDLDSCINNEYTIKTTKKLMESNVGNKVYVVNKSGNHIQINNIYILDNIPLFCDKRIRRLYIKKDGYYIQLEKSNN